MKNLQMFASMAVVLGSVSAFGVTKGISMTLDSGATVDYKVSSVDPVAQDTTVASLGGSVGITIEYPATPAGECPAPTAVSINSRLRTHDVEMNMNLGSSNGTYTYDLAEALGDLTGASLPIASGSIDLSNASLVVNEGSLGETGTGTLGSNFQRVTDFATDNKTYELDGGTASLAVAPVGAVYCNGLTGCHRDCKFTLTLDAAGHDTLWSTPAEILLDFDINLVAEGVATF